MSFTTFNFSVNILIWSDILFCLLVPTETVETRRYFWYFFGYSNLFIALVYIPIVPSTPPAIGLVFGFFGSLAGLLAVRLIDFVPFWKVGIPWLVLLLPATLEVLVVIVVVVFRR